MQYCDVIAPDTLNQDVQHWSGIILHMLCAFIDPTWGVLFKILMTRIIPVARAALIDYVQLFRHGSRFGIIHLTMVCVLLEPESKASIPESSQVVTQRPI